MLPDPTAVSEVPSLVVPRRVSKKRHIYDSLLSRIRDQSLPMGTRLPSATVLASEWQVAYATVHAALNELTRDGWLVRYPKQGTFVSTPPKAHSERLTKTATIFLPPRKDIVAAGSGDEVLDLLQGLVDGACAVDWKIRIESVPSNQSEVDQERVRESIRSASAAIFIDTQYRTLIQQLAAEGFPTVTMLADSGFGTVVTYDRQNGARLGVEHLIRKGYRKIGYFGNTREVGPGKKFQTYREILRQNGLEPVAERIGHCSSHLTAKENIHDFLQQRPDCDALFVANYRFASALVQEARHCGIRIPGDMAIVANGIEGNPIDGTPLTYVRVPYLEMGVAAMQWLSTGLDAAPGKDREIITLQPSLILRASS